MSRTFAAIVVVAFAAAAFAGCQGAGPEPTSKPSPTTKHLGAVPPSVYQDRLSKQIYSTADMVREHVLVPSFDGKKMDNWVFRPKVADGVKVPVFINFSPYWSNAEQSAESGGDHFSHYMIDEYVPRGYAIVLSSARGTGFSEGCFNIGGDTEKKDSEAVVSYFAKQAWSNGNIGAGAKSYDGTMANGVATLGDPALKMIFPVEPISELYLYSFKGGIAYRPYFSATYYEGESTTQTWTTNPLLIPEDAVCPDLKGHVVDNLATGATGDDDAYWLERNYTKDASKYQGAVFYVQGFNDWNVKPDSIDLLTRFPGPKIAYLHNWTGHGLLNPGTDGHVYPKRDDWNVTMLRFMDQTLKGIDTGIFDEPSYHVQDSNGLWHWETEWPPARAALTKFYFGASGGTSVLDPGAPVRGSPVTFSDNGQGPAATVKTGANFVRFDGPVLTEDLHYAGTPRVHMEASSDRPVGKVVAMLADVAPDGSAKYINWGGLNLRHRLSVQNPQMITPDAVYKLNFDLFPQDDVVPAGHHLALVLAGGPGAGATNSGGFGFMSEPTQETMRILPGTEAYVELPVLTSVHLEDPQPVPIPCFTC